MLLFTSVVMTSVVIATEEDLFSAFLVIAVFVAIYGLTFTLVRRHGVASITLLAVLFSIFAAVRRQNIWRRSARNLAEFWPRLGLILSG